MKTITKSLVQIALGLVISSSAAFAKDVVVIWENTRVYKLQSDQPKISVELHYPGDISGLCGVEIRSDSSGRERSIEKLLDAIHISPRFGHEEIPQAVLKSSTTISIDLNFAAQHYMTSFNIETKSGKSLSQVIEETLGQNRRVVVLGTTCN